MEYGSQIARGDVAVVPERGPRAPSRSLRQPHHTWRASRRDRSGAMVSRDGHKEEERQRGAASQREDHRQRAAADAAVAITPTTTAFAREPIAAAHTITSAEAGTTIANQRPVARRGRGGMRQGGCQRGASVSSPTIAAREDRAERARLQRDGECVEATRAEPQRASYQHQQRHAKTGSGKSRTTSRNSACTQRRNRMAAR